MGIIMYFLICCFLLAVFAGPLLCSFDLAFCKASHFPEREFMLISEVLLMTWQLCAGYARFCAACVVFPSHIIS